MGRHHGAGLRLRIWKPPPWSLRLHLCANAVSDQLGNRAAFARIAQY